MSSSRVPAARGAPSAAGRAVVWTTHALERLAERGFTRGCVEAGLAQPFAEGIAGEGAYWTLSRVVCISRWRWLLVVWFPEAPRVARVLTVYQPDKIRPGGNVTGYMHDVVTAMESEPGPRHDSGGDAAA